MTVHRDEEAMSLVGDTGDERLAALKLAAVPFLANIDAEPECPMCAWPVFGDHDFDCPLPALEAALRALLEKEENR